MKPSHRQQSSSTTFASARDVAVRVLLRVETQEAYSNIVLDAEMSRQLMDERDKRLCTRIVYGTLAMQRPIDAQLALLIEADPATRLDPMMRASLRSALYQLRYLDKTPAHAVVDEVVELVKRERGARPAGYANAILRKAVRRAGVLEGERAAASEAEAFGMRYSLPDELAQRAIEVLGAERAARWGEAINLPAPLYLRLRVQDEELRAAGELRLHDSALRLERFEGRAKRALQEGEAVVQDLGSQLAVRFAGGLEGLRVWDVCAGQGVKSLHLADRMGGSGELWLSDLHESKLRRARSLLQRCGVTAQSVAFDAAKGPLPAELESERFEVVFVDAPCSALGLLRRHPELRWRHRSAQIPTLAKLQGEILARASALVAAGGLLLYAVCTDSPEECVQQVEAFLAAHSEFALESRQQVLAALGEQSEDAAYVDERGCLRTFIDRDDCDAFFAARLRRRV
ncbi:MAG: transcription antitermination factor NusB [Myxococcota bacterium]|nr:transcription antitermination factor NusB [Myxococcota bacterium]